MTEPFDLEYADNDRISVGDRLAAEIENNPDRLDVATGYLTPSVWSVVGEALAKVGDFRLLLGKDFELARRAKGEEEAEIRALVREAIKDDTEPPRLPVEQDAAAVDGLLDFLRRDSSDLKVWTEGFLHAKAYLLTRSVGVGSANFTAGGLVANRELVAWRQDVGVVRQFQEWFDRHWDAPEAAPYKDELIEILEQSRFGSYSWTPYQLLIRTLAERYGIERPASLAQATFTLQWFQEDAVYRLIRLLNGPARGALLADAVGLGKTYMGIAVIHHYLYQAADERRGRGRPVLLIVPASLKPMWEAKLQEHNLDWACNLVTVQSLRAGIDVTTYVGADLVVIDEAHRLRSGRRWFQEVMRILTEGSADKRVLLLTATPVHTSLRDLTNLLRVLSRNQRGVWAPTIADFERYLKRVERQEADPFPLLDRSIVRRSRSDLLRAYEEQIAAGLHVNKPALPNRKLSHATYEYVEGGGSDLFSAFVSTVRGLHLAPYDLEQFEREGLADGAKPSPSSLVGLYVAGLLKRFESSLRAVAISLRRLEALLRRFLAAVGESPPKVFDLSANPRLRELIEREADQDEDDDEEDLELAWGDALAALQPLSDPERYDLEAIKEATERDIEAVSELISALPAEDSDGKIKALVSLLEGRELTGKRVLIFTQFRDTASYVAERLREVASLREGVALVHGGVSPNQRREITTWFDPDESEHVVQRMTGGSEPTILVSTDVLAEGHNLQLALAAVNFDLHWNPQVAVQRSGRVDRLNSPHKTVRLISFLPEEGLEAHLGLVHALDERFGLIHYLGLGDEPVTELAGDFQSVTFEQLRKLYADDENVLDEVERLFALGSTDYMRAPLEQFLLQKGEEELRKIPVGVQSVRHAPTNWRFGPGVFVALKFGEQSVWRYYPRSGDGWGEPIVDEPALFKAIVCGNQEPRVSLSEPPPGPGGVVDWSLLARAAREVAEELTSRRATADIARGASERSAKMRAEIRQIARAADVETDDLILLLDRLEQVRVEDFDASPGFRPLEERLRRARKVAGEERRGFIEDAIQRGLELLGPPEQDDTGSVIEVSPESLILVSWEWVVAPPRTEGRGPTAEQLDLSTRA
jgi:superfamily II DNA or RNA helicase